MTENTLVLPKHFVLKSKSNGKYLKFVHEDGPQRGLLRFSEDHIMSPYAKFEAEPYSASHRDGEELVHLKCCYNNKYWVKSASGNWIAGEADVAEEERLKWTCTLFKPNFVPDKEHPGQLVRLVHVHLNRYARLSSPDPAKGYVDILSVEGDGGERKKQDDMSDVYEVVNMRDKINLPKYVVFKGDNTHYLMPIQARYPRPYVSGNFGASGPVPPAVKAPFLQFSGNDRTDPRAVVEVLPDLDGNIRLRSDQSSKDELWELFSYDRNDPLWVTHNRTSEIGGLPTLFQVVKLGDDAIALKSIAGGKYCKRFTNASRRFENCLAAHTDNIGDPCVRLTVEEPVVSRTVDGFVYHEEDVRVHMKPTTLTVVDSHANHSQAEGWKSYKTYTGRKSNSTWNRTTTTISSSKWNTDLEVKDFKIAKLPFAATLGIHHEEFSQLTDTVTWGETKEYKTGTGHGVDYKVPPMTKVTIYEKRTEVTRDVPFSYTQTDMFRNGTSATYAMHDGLYTYTTTMIETDAFEEKLN